MPLLHRLSVTIKALTELGPGALELYGRYQLGLRSGYLRWRTPPYRVPSQSFELNSLPFLIPPSSAILASLMGNAAPALVSEADEIANSQARLFGGEPRHLMLEPPVSPAHWTEYARGRAVPGSEDVKLVWEAGRFGWALTLARAHQLTGDAHHAATFWRLTERFLDANPSYFGPHWESAQEVAIRMICFVFAFQALRESSETTAPRAAALAHAIAAHAERIPVTLAYARAQNNNHLLAEAAGLLTASGTLPDHPESPKWMELGWGWFNHGLQSQIASDGSYTQQSANYHRLMLQISLWGAAAARNQGLELEPASHERLAAATRWALALLDPHSGQLPNLGPNDGSQLLPLAATSYQDHRPTLAAAALAFLGERPFPPGPWDELGLWLGLKPDQPGRAPIVNSQAQPQIVLHNTNSNSWAYLRVQEFTNRPGHADLLHLDLWQEGINLAQDAGTYLYNAEHPWDNALARTAVHNTVTIAGQDQMTRAGRFLWLDWPGCEIRDWQPLADGALKSVTAWHDGYRRLGVDHERTVEARSDGTWLVEDFLSPNGRAGKEQVFLARLHWLLQDWPWTMEEEGPVYRLRLESPRGIIWLGLGALESQATIQLVRAGEVLVGPGPTDPTHGWASLTYADKRPALSLALLAKGPLPIRLRSVWRFEEDK